MRAGFNESPFFHTIQPHVSIFFINKVISAWMCDFNLFFLLIHAECKGQPRLVEFAAFLHWVNSVLCPVTSFIPAAL